jgi:hypothetical protein
MRRAAQQLATAPSAARLDQPTPPEQREPIPLRRPPAVIPFWRRSPWTSAIAAVLAVAVLSVGAYTYENQVVGSYALTGSLRGSAVVKIHRSGAAELELNGVEAPPPGLLYAAWIIPEGGQPITAGVLVSGDAQLSLERLSNRSTVALTEERGRVSAPTSQPVMAVTVQL